MGISAIAELLVIISGGLDSLCSLHTLILSHNQLITTKLLSEAPAIQVLDVAHNHLPLLDGVGRLPLLQSLDARDNNLLSVSTNSSRLLYTWMKNLIHNLKHLLLLLLLFFDPSTQFSGEKKLLSNLKAICWNNIINIIKNVLIRVTLVANTLQGHYIVW